MVRSSIQAKSANGPVRGTDVAGTIRNVVAVTADVVDTEYEV
jgi:hypothetical protein